MSAKWPLTPLGEILRLDTNRVAVDASVTYPMVGVLSFGRGLFDREPIINGDTSYKFFYKLDSDHFVMSQLFGWEGALALSSKDFAGKFVSPQFPTFRCDSNRLDSEFLVWVTRRPDFWEQLGMKASGIGDRRRTLTPNALLTSEVPLPPIAEQRRIVAFVGAVAGKIGEAKRLKAAAAAETNAVCRSMLSHAKTNDLVPMQSLVSMRAADVIVRAEETYQFAGVYSFGRGVFRSVLKAGTETSYQRLTRVSAGDFVYPKLMAWEGALGVVPEDCDGCVVSPEFPVFSVDTSKVLPDVLDVHFRSPSVWPKIAGLSKGTNVRRRRLHPTAFLTYMFPLPDRDTQHRVVQVRRALNRMFDINQSLGSGLDALAPASLDKALTGRI